MPSVRGQITPASPGPRRPARERGRDQGFLRGQNEILELIATGPALPQILDRLMRLVEAGAPGMRCSVLLLDDQGRHLRHGVADRNMRARLICEDETCCPRPACRPRTTG